MVRFLLSVWRLTVLTSTGTAVWHLSPRKRSSSEPHLHTLNIFEKSLAMHQLLPRSVFSLCVQRFWLVFPNSTVVQLLSKRLDCCKYAGNFPTTFEGMHWILSNSLKATAEIQVVRKDYNLKKNAINNNNTGKHRPWGFSLMETS